jgi:hypothetical protein
MAKRRIKLEGPAAKGVVVNAVLLRNLLSLVIDGSQRALRMRTQGRSTARGSLPRWIAAASQMDVQILPGSTILEIDAPTLLEADPEEFQQNTFFPEVDADLTAIDYLAESLAAATGATEGKADCFDKPLLELFRDFEGVFDHGISSMAIEGRTLKRGKPLRIGPEEIRELRDLEKKIPPAQEILLAGRLDTIRHSDRTFTLVAVETSETVKGIADTQHDLPALWGEDVLVSGTAHFGADGRILRVETRDIRKANERDLQLWAAIPEPLETAVLAVPRASQGPRTGLNAVFGRWPGDETDDEVSDALSRMS